MKLISLNTYDGFFFDALVAFIRQHKDSTDAFLFQEVCSAPPEASNIKGFHSRLYQELCEELVGFQPRFVAMMHHFNPGLYNTADPVDFGKATFIREPREIISTGEVNVVGNILNFDPHDLTTFPSNFLFSQLEVRGVTLTLCNEHGLPLPGTKRDTSDRLEQSKKMIEFLDLLPGEKIIAGDFNLLPDTESVHMFVENGYRNLIEDFGIKTTRGTLNRTLHPEYANTPEGFQEYADFMFVSPGIKVKSFDVPDVKVSDHLPMIVEFDI